MDQETEKKQGLFNKSLFKNKWGKDQYVMLVLVGILLLVIAIPTSGKKESASPAKSGIWDSGSDKLEETQSSDANDTIQEESAEKSEIEEYESYMENKLEQILSEMEGAGKVKVVVTVSASSETVVEKDSPAIRNHTTENDAQGGSRIVNETDFEEETVYQKNSSGEETPFVVKTLQPVVEGVLVVAQGAGQEKISSNITDAIVALFNIEPHKIKVVKMKTE